MITKEIAMNAKHSTVFYHASKKNADGSRLRARVNGQCVTWKTRPDDFKLPMKHGLKHCFYISEFNQDEWLTDEEAKAADKAEHFKKHEGFPLKQMAVLMGRQKMNAKTKAPLPAGIEVGKRIVLKCDVERFPHFIALRFSTGQITEVGDRHITAKMDKHIAGAEAWNNSIIWSDQTISTGEYLKDFLADTKFIPDVSIK